VWPERYSTRKEASFACVFYQRDGYISPLQNAAEECVDRELRPYFFFLYKIPSYTATAIMPVSSSKIQYRCLPHPLPASPIENTFPDEHFSQKADSIPALHSNSLFRPFSQPAIRIHHPLPPRPPTVVPSSTTNRINGHSPYLNNFNQIFDGPVSATGGGKNENRESLICVPAKGMYPPQVIAVSPFSAYTKQNTVIKTTPVQLCLIGAVHAKQQP
jgi:hypothetical protein